MKKHTFTSGSTSIFAYMLLFTPSCFSICYSKPFLEWPHCPSPPANLLLFLTHSACPGGPSARSNTQPGHYLAIPMSPGMSRASAASCPQAAPPPPCLGDSSSPATVCWLEQGGPEHHAELQSRGHCFPPLHVTSPTIRRQGALAANSVSSCLTPASEIRKMRQMGH